MIYENKLPSKDFKVFNKKLSKKLNTFYFDYFANFELISNTALIVSS